MNKYYSPNESQTRTAVKGADRHDYYRRRRLWLRLVLHGLAAILLVIAFFAACLIIAEVMR